MNSNIDIYFVTQNQQLADFLYQEFHGKEHSLRVSIINSLNDIKFVNNPSDNFIVVYDYDLGWELIDDFIAKNVDFFNLDNFNLLLLIKEPDQDIVIKSIAKGFSDYIMEESLILEELLERIKPIIDTHELESNRQGVLSDENNILIVDDVETNLYILEQLLKEDKRNIVLANSGKEAIWKVLREDFALILLDVQMPEMDGFEVARLLKQNFRTRNIPIVFVTAHNKKTEFVVKGLEYGAIDYLYKPLDPLITRSKVDSFIKMRNYQIAIKNRNQELNTQRKIINDKNKSITDSITYASRIQNALLPETAIFKKLFEDYFVIYKPKDIVSGDFYWIHQIEDEVLIAVIDCTGHGVPGAFMSMIANAIFNDIIVAKEILETDKILNIARERLIAALQQDMDSDQRDGLDIVLCRINLKNLKLEYSGAYNPLWILNENRETWPDNCDLNTELNIGELRADKQPIGLFPFGLKPFTKTEVQLIQGDQIYLFTDGYADQFGSENNSKFLSRNLKKLISKNAELPMHIQQLEMLKNLDEWKGNRNQTDDICVIGLKF